MNKVFLKTPSALIAGVALLSITACTESNEPATAGGGSDETIPLALKGMPAPQAPGNASDALSEVNVFHFKGEDFLQRTDINDPYAESISLPTNGTTRIYCIGGLQISASQGTKEADFLTTTVNCEPNSEHSPLFYSGSADFPNKGIHAGGLEIEMKRSVARIDFVNTVDPEIKISKIIVEDAPSATFVFEQEGTAECSSISFTREFAESFSGKEEGMFTIFESASPVHVRILGDYKDTPINIRTTLATTERNKVYTLQIVNINSNVEGAFTVKDWEEGHHVGAVPSSANLMLDKVNSSIPAGVDVDYATNRVTVPFAGANGIKLAFLAKTKVSVASIEGEISTAKVTANEPVKVEEGFISSVNLTVDPNNRLAYSLIINVKDEEGRHNFVEVTVATNPDREIETVEIAGRTWMAFNAMSKDPKVQVFPIDGLTVEEMYQTNWATAIGSFFQYGKVKNYSPWTRNDPNGNSETERNAPWGNAEAMPVPEGFHVSTADDWRALMPNGTTFPSTYAAGNGEMIKAELVTLPGTLNNSPSAAANRAGLLMRYLRFESLETGNVLIIPICGMKTASLDEYPGGGKALHIWGGYWIYEDRCLWLFQVGGSAEEPEVTQGPSKWNYDGFMPVRGVKNAD